MLRRLWLSSLLLCSITLLSQLLFAQPAKPAAAGPPATWSFVLDGDSRNCGDLIMPVIAKRAIKKAARFYWHLGDLRAMFEVDEDYAGLHRKDPGALTLENYQKAAWDDFKANQIKPFGTIPFFLGIGNHELIGRTKAQFVEAFREQLNMELIRKQREADDPNDHTVRTYYHWVTDGIDFINLDNADNVFDDAELAWATKLIASDQANPQIRALVVGMHEALPDSYSLDHSMNQGADKGMSGRIVYKDLLALRAQTGKAVYVVASHSHYFLSDIYNTGKWQGNGGVLPGWIVGTAGAQFYSVPPGVKDFAKYAQGQYGYVVVTVNSSRASRDPVELKFVQIKESELGPEIVNKFGADVVRFCFSENWRATMYQQATVPAN
ncbi:MAG: hypothetical protein WBW33_08755 [Bryobacteraceae bacterium]